MEKNNATTFTLEEAGIISKLHEDIIDRMIEVSSNINDPVSELKVITFALSLCLDSIAYRFKLDKTAMGKYLSHLVNNTKLCLGYEAE